MREFAVTSGLASAAVIQSVRAAPAAERKRFMLIIMNSVQVQVGPLRYGHGMPEIYRTAQRNNEAIRKITN